MLNNLIFSEIKSLLESNPVAIATVMENGNPNVIGVSFVKIVDEKLIVTDNYMNQTLKDIKYNPNVVALVWNKSLEGYKMIGQAKYCNSGEWLEFVKNIPENKNMPTKGALLISVDKVIKTA